jgi:DNA-binding transcriptional regulator GbsR (MarR family)
MSGVPNLPPNEVRSQYLEELTMLFARHGLSRMAGRVLAFLLLNDKPGVSSRDIAADLQASAGSVSTATRELAEAGCVRRLTVPGSRSHYFKAADNMWDTLLSTERLRLARVTALVEEIMQAADLDIHARTRLDGMRVHYAFLQRSYARLCNEWTEFKHRHDTERGDEVTGLAESAGDIERVSDDLSDRTSRRGGLR